MGVVVIESEVWEPNQSAYVFIFVLCLFSIVGLPFASNNNNNRAVSATVFDHSLPNALLRFQKTFLLIYSLSSVMEGVWTVFGEYDLANSGYSREQMVLSLSVGSGAALCIGTFLGMLSDLVGQKKVCLMFCILHLFVGIWKSAVSHPSVWLASIFLSIANSMFSFGFETWMVVEHDKLGYRLDTLNNMFWLMYFSESASFIGSQVLANWLVNKNVSKHMVSPSATVALLAFISIISLTRCSKESASATFKEYKKSFYERIFGDKRIWLLSWAQSCVHFSVVVFWILWSPTIVADGREVHLGMIYPCLLGARMLGSTVFPWFVGGPLSFRTEDYLAYVFMLAGLVLSIVAYDYQEIGFLVVLFCLFHACIGLILPSLARLRSQCIPNELRGGMISLSLAPANVALLFCLIQGGFYRSIENSTIIALAALSLMSAAGCMYMLKRMGKHSSRQDFHKL